jgi:hypothetical protein
MALHFGQDIIMVKRLQADNSDISATLFSKTFMLCHHHSQFIRDKTAQNVNELRYSTDSLQFIQGGLHVI